MHAQPLSSDQRDAFWDALTRRLTRRPPNWRICDAAAVERTRRRERRGGPDMRHGASVLSCAFSPDGMLLAAAGGGRLPGAEPTIRCWDVASRQETLLCQGHAGGIFCIDFDPRTGLLASAGRDHTVILWNLEARDAVAVCRDDRIVKGHVAFAEAGPLLAVGEIEAPGSRHCSAYVLDLGTGEETFRLALPPRHTVNAMGLSRDGTRLALASQDLHYGGESVLRVCRMPGGEEVFSNRFEASPRETTFTRLRFFADGTGLAAAAMEFEAGCEAHVYAMDAATGDRLAGRRLGGIGAALAVSPAGDVLACAGEARRVELLTVPGLEPIETRKPKKLPRKARVSSLAFSPDGTLLAAGASTGEVDLLEVP